MVHKPFSSSTMSTAASMIQNHRRSSNGSSAEYELSSSVRPRRQEGQGTRTNGSNPLLTASTINSSYNAMDYDNTAAISSTMPRFPNVPGRPDSLDHVVMAVRCLVGSTNRKTHVRFEEEVNANPCLFVERRM